MKRFGLGTWGFGVAGVAALLGAAWTLYVGHVTTSWPQVEGEVVDGHIQRDVNTEGDAHFEPQLRYRYVVGDVAYEGERIERFGVGYSARSDASDVLAAHPVGSTLPVYYDPAEPESAVLEPGVQPLVPIGLGVFAVMLFAFARGASTTKKEQAHGES